MGSEDVQEQFVRNAHLDEVNLRGANLTVTDHVSGVVGEDGSGI